METGEKQAFVADLERQHGRRLRRFLGARLRHGAADVEDLVQEVFLRLLRIDRLETIRSTESYLYMIAFHVLRHPRRPLLYAGYPGPRCCHAAPRPLPFAVFRRRPRSARTRVARAGTVPPHPPRRARAGHARAGRGGLKRETGLQ